MSSARKNMRGYMAPLIGEPVFYDGKGEIGMDKRMVFLYNKKEQATAFT